MLIKLEQASAIVTKPVQEKEDWFTKATDWAVNHPDIYTVSMSFVLEATNGAATRLSMHRQKSMPQNVSLAGREQILQTLIDEMITELDQATVRALDHTLRILAVPSETVRPVFKDTVISIRGIDSGH